MVKRLLADSHSLCVQKEVGLNGKWHLQGVVVLLRNTNPHDLKRLYPGIWTTTYPNFNIDLGVHYCSKPVQGCVCRHCKAAKLVEAPKWHIRKGCRKAIPLVSASPTVPAATQKMWKEINAKRAELAQNLTKSQ